MDGANVDPSLSRIYVLSQMGSAYFSQVHGIDVNDWPDNLMVMSDADSVFFSKVDGIDVNDWPDTLRVMPDAGMMFYALIDGIDVNPGPETIRVMQGVGQTFGAALDGILLKRYVMEYPRIMNEVGPIYGGTVRGSELGDPSIIRIDMAPHFEWVRLPYADGIELKRYVNDMIITGDTDIFRGGILRGPELGIPSESRIGQAISFSNVRLPDGVGLIVKDVVDSNYIMLESDPIRGGVLRGPELGIPSETRTGVAPFFSFDRLPDGSGIILKDIVNDMMVSSLYDAFRGGVFRGKELGEPSELRIDVDFDSPGFIVLTPDQCPEEAIAPKRIVDDAMQIGPIDDVPVGIGTLYASSQPTILSLLEGFGTDFERETRAYDTLHASSAGSTNLINGFTDAWPFLEIIDTEFTKGVRIGPSTSRIRVTDGIGTVRVLT